MERKYFSILEVAPAFVTKYAGTPMNYADAMIQEGYLSAQFHSLNVGRHPKAFSMLAEDYMHFLLKYG